VVKTRLMTPGPVEIPPDTLLEMARPIFHHRTPRFRKVAQDLAEGLKYVFQTTSDAIMLASSGTGGMEASVVNVLAPGEKAIFVRGGKFGERWGELCECFGAKGIALDVAPGESVDPLAVKDALEKHPDAKAVYTTLCETSTGALTDIRAIGEIVREHRALLVVDGISGAGAVELRCDAWGVDILVVGSQKALMVPPGLAVAIVSPKAWEVIERCPSPRYYFDLRAARKKLKDFDTPFTPGITLMTGLAKSVEAIRAEGIENVWRRHHVLAEAMRAAVRAMNLRIFPRVPADALTAVVAPQGIEASKLVAKLEKEHGITVAAGQEELKNKIWRVAHMGYVDSTDILAVVAATEAALKSLGHSLALGAGVSAAQGVLAAK